MIDECAESRVGMRQEPNEHRGRETRRERRHVVASYYRPHFHRPAGRSILPARNHGVETRQARIQVQGWDRVGHAACGAVESCPNLTKVQRAGPQWSIWRGGGECVGIADGLIGRAVDVQDVNRLRGRGIKRGGVAGQAGNRSD